MSQTSGFFNAIIEGGNPDRAYDAADFAKYFAAFIGNGIFAGNKNNLAVTTNDNNLSVKVKSGRAFVNGYWYDSDANVVLNITRNDLTPSAYPRWDGVVLSFDFANRTAVLEVKTGTSAQTYKAGKQHIYNNLSRNLSGIYQLCLAIIRVPQNAVTYQVLSSDIYDVRAEKYCGWVAGLVQQLDVSSVTEQLQAEFDTWFSHVQDQLSEDVAGNLQYQIDLLNHTLSEQTPVVLYESYTDYEIEEDSDDYIQLSQPATNFKELEIYYASLDNVKITNSQYDAYKIARIKIPENVSDLIYADFSLFTIHTSFSSDDVNFEKTVYGFVRTGKPLVPDRIYKSDIDTQKYISVYKFKDVWEEPYYLQLTFRAESFASDSRGAKIVKIVGYGNRNIIPIPTRSYSEVLRDNFAEDVSENM